jgi:hypothetical protein
MRSSLAWALVAVVLAGCAAPAGGSPSAGNAIASSQAPPLPASGAVETPGATVAPTGPTLPTTEPTGPSWTPRPAEPLLLNSAVSVVVDRLNLRDQPTIDSKSLGVAERGDFLLIWDFGPFSNDGYAWYHAVFLAKAGEPPSLGVDLRHSDGIQGWIAAAKGSTKYVKQLGPRCPAAIDVSSLGSMLGSELLACFGSNTIELTGTYGCGGCGGARLGIYEPVWLAHPLNAGFLSVYPVGERLGAFLLHFPPTTAQEPAAGSVIRVRGHFDDAAARTCEISIGDPLHPEGESLVPLDSAAAQLVCAQQFVVEDLVVLGTDPGFQLG